MKIINRNKHTGNKNTYKIYTGSSWIENKIYSNISN